MRVVYICGPFSAPTGWGVAKNVHRARERAMEAASCGVMTLCPHAIIGADHHGPWYEGCIELLSRCDAVLLTEDWFSSDGARAEVQAAHALGKPVLDSLDGLRAWLAPKEEK